jgi:CheY-like chemotaxis protein
VRNDLSNDKKAKLVKIRIVANNLTSRTVLTAVLKKQGHEVEATVNGAEAWQSSAALDKSFHMLIYT